MTAEKAAADCTQRVTAEAAARPTAGRPEWINAASPRLKAGAGYCYLTVRLPLLANRTYRHLFAAQVIALFGTGQDAGAVLGTALAIKMIACVRVAPLVGDLAGRLPRRAFPRASIASRPVSPRYFAAL